MTEEILWPEGVRDAEALRTLSPLGDAYKVKDDSSLAVVELQEKIKRVEKAVDALRGAIGRLQQEAEEQSETEYDDGDEEDYDAVSHVYDKKVRKQRDLFSDENVQVKIEERQAELTALEEKLDGLRKRFSEVESLRIKTLWETGDLPPQFTPLDQPWVKNESKPRSSSAIVNYQPRLARKAGGDEMSENSRKTMGRSVAGRNADAGADGKAESEAADATPRYYFVKLFRGLPATVGEGRRTIFHSDARDDREALSTLMYEGEQLMNYQWKAIFNRMAETDVAEVSSKVAGESAAVKVGKARVSPTKAGEAESTGTRQRFQAAGVLPLAKVARVELRKHHGPSRWAAAFFSPICKHGSIADGLKRIEGHRCSTWFDDRLILENLQRSIRTMAQLEQFEIFHGAIKPSNVCISDDGFCLLISDFLTPSLYERYLVDLSRHLTAVSPYTAPEILQAVIKERSRTVSSLRKIVNLHKADVFALGAVYYYITVRSAPKDFNKSPKAVKDGLAKLQADNHRPELVMLLKTMLEFDCKSRPSFWTLLSSAEQWAYTGGKWIEAAKNLFGFNGLLG